MTVRPALCHHARPQLRLGLLALLAVLISSVLVACSPSSQREADPDVVKIVASTPIWADLAQAVTATAHADAGVQFTVSSVVTNADTDPHHFEPSAAALASATEADLLVVNGGGYDAWLYEPVNRPEATVSALPLVGHGQLSAANSIDGNEHAWYDGEILSQVARDIAAALNTVAPQAQITADAAIAEIQQATAPLAELSQLAAQGETLTYVQTEPIADYLLAATPAEDISPEGFRAAILKHNEPSAADLARLLQVISSGEVDVLIYNPQTATDISRRIYQASEAAGLAIVELGETPPDGSPFLEYLAQRAAAVAAAFAAGAGA